MKMRKFIMVLLVLMMSVSAVYANSAMKEWEGTDANGVVTKDENCPLVITHEDLTFHIVDFPTQYSSQSTISTVSALYTFHNPADYDVRATAYFPIGTLPGYLAYNQQDPYMDATITVESEPVPLIRRYTLYKGSFDVNTQLSKILDDYVASTRFRPDMTFHQYTVSAPSATGAYLQVGIASDGFMMLIEPDGYGRLYQDGQGNWMVRDFVANKPIVLYTSVPISSCRLYGDVKLESPLEEEPVLEAGPDVDLMTLLHGFTKAEGISDVDLFNAFVDQTEENWCQFIYTGDLFYHNLLAWYEYELNVKAGATVTNEVTTAIYPTINAYYQPTVYYYTYLSSPAKTWSSFKDMDIYLETEYYLVDDDGFDFEKTATGYHAHLNHLPENDIYLSLSTEANPTRAGDTYTNIFIVFMLVSLVLFILLVIGIIWLIRRLRKRKKNQKA